MQAMASQALSASFLHTNSRRSLTFNFSPHKPYTSPPHKSRSGDLQSFAGKLRAACSSINCQLVEARNGLESSRREAAIGLLAGAAVILFACDKVEAASTSKRALRAQKIPESEFTTLPNGLKLTGMVPSSSLRNSCKEGQPKQKVDMKEKELFQEPPSMIMPTGRQPQGFKLKISSGKEVQAKFKDKFKVQLHEGFITSSKFKAWQ